MSFLVTSAAQEREVSRCRFCGKSMLAKRSWARFCSVECRGRFHYEQKNPQASVPPPSRSCSECGKSFRSRRDAQRFCSGKCRASYNAKANPRLSTLRTTAEMAKILGVSPATVRSRIRSGELTAHRIGGILLVVAPETEYIPQSPRVAAPVADRFRSFAEKHSLSFRELGKILGLSGTSAFRLLNGKLTASTLRRSRNGIIVGLRSYLSSLGASPADIEHEIEKLFKDH